MWYKIKDSIPIKTIRRGKGFTVQIVFIGEKGAYTNYVYQRYGD